jgi:hypothetical protein
VEIEPHHILLTFGTDIMTRANMDLSRLLNDEIPEKHGWKNQKTKKKNKAVEEERKYCTNQNTV